MKSFFALSLALVVLLNSLSKVFLVVGYELNKEYITSVFCVNRDMPQLRCNGQCHLKKQLNKAEEKETKAGHHPKEKFELTYWMADGTAFIFNSNPLTLTKHFLYLNKGYNAPSHAVYHPPQ